MRSVSSSTRSALLMMGLCLPLALHAQSTGFSGTAALSSQLFDRGQAVTRNTPILQGAASWTFPASWTLGVSGSSELRSPGHVVEALVQASRDWSLSDDWRVQTSLLYYTYNGNARANAFDRTEAGLHWTYRDVLTFGLSAIYVIGAKGHRPRGAADLSLHWPLAWHFSLSAGAGVAQSSIAPYTPYTRYAPYRYGQSNSYDYDRASPYGYVRAGLYGYGHAGLLWSNGPWRVELDRIVADQGAQRQWNDLRASPWVATISRSF
jgi:uncharacterized protein (TIGR02001 family)